MRPINNTLIF